MAKVLLARVRLSVPSIAPHRRLRDYKSDRKGECPLPQHPQDNPLELLRTITGPADWVTEAAAAPPFGPALDAAVTRHADNVEVWGTTEDAPEDYTEFRLMQDHRVIGLARISGC